MGKMVRQPKLMKVPSGMERRRSSYMSGSRGFVAKENDLYFAEKMLTIRNQSLSIDFLKEIVQRWIIENDVDIKLFTPNEYELILKLLSIKDIIFRTSRQAVTIATQNLVALLGFNYSIINAIANVITTDSEVS